MAGKVTRREIVEDPTWLDEVEDGTRNEFELTGFDRGDCGPLTVPVHVLAGHGPRPRLVVIAGVHGDEPDGILALLGASLAISPTSLRGRLVVVPVAHPPAFAAGQRKSPIDGLDLNRVFPGRVDGLPTDRLAHRLFHMVVRRADFVFTLHSWYATGTVLPFVEVLDDNSDVAAASLAAARASGFGRIRLTTWPDGLLVRAANAIGVPGMEAEIGDSGISSPENQRLCRRHLDLLLVHLGMIDAASAPRSERPETFHGFHIHSPFAGVLKMNVALGDEVLENTSVADVMDIHGRPVGEVKSPAAGTVISRRSYGSVAVSDILATVFSRE